jgi:hypothetical protein
MAYEAGALDETLSAAAGDDMALYAELRGAFIDSITRQVDLLSRARCDGNWHVSAMRLKGLGASFQVWPLLDLADLALESAPGDPVILRRLNAFVESFRQA